MELLPQRRHSPVLVADHDTDNCLVVLDAWEEAGLGKDLRFVQDGLELMDYLHNRGIFSNSLLAPRPSLVLLDQDLPKRCGLEVLAAIKADDSLQTIPVIALAGADSAEQIAEFYALGASGVVIKPIGVQAYMEALRKLRIEWAAFLQADNLRFSP